VAGASRHSVILGAVVCALGLLAPAAIAGPIVAGLGGGEPVYEIIRSYTTTNPNVAIDDLGTPIDVAFDPAAGPIAKVFHITTPAYHHLHLVETLRVVGRTIYDWHELLMVSDGEGGWQPSGNHDDLWWSCTGGVTPWPIVAPFPSLIEKLNPDDLLSIYWDEGLPDGTVITIEKWITVPSTMTTFAMFQYPTPEPATTALLGLGLGWLVAARHRRNRAHL